MQKSGSKIRLKLASEHGLALMEVVMASVVLGVAVVGVALMLSSARSMVVAQGDDRVAFYLAQEKLENLQAQGFAGVPASLTCPGTPSNETLTAGADNTQTFTRQTTVFCVAKSDLNTCVACPTPQVLKHITVTVRPSMRQADPVSLPTVLACQQC